MPSFLQSHCNSLLSYLESLRFLLTSSHVCIGVLTVVSILVFRSHFRTASTFPGPRPYPWVGNIFDFDPRSPFTTFTKWKYEFGDVVGLRALGTNIVVLNSLDTINDLLDKRGTNYSHRPIFTVVGELMDLDNSMPLLPYGPQWRASRKLAHQALSPSAVVKYHTLQEDIAALLANEIVDNPADFYDLVRMAAARVILAVTYGLSVKTADSEYITHADATMKMVSESTVPGAYLCDLIPIMKFLPSWLPFQRRAKQGKAMIANFVDMPFEQVKSDMKNGTARPSLTQDLLLNMNMDDDLTQNGHEHLVKWTTGSMYGAGGETTYSTVLNFITAMALHLDVQVRAQEELDAVIEADRLPTMADRSDEQLPYLKAVIKETMRWSPVLPLSIARRSDKADTYRGIDIPANTIIMPNSWAVAFQPDAKYPADQFIPERFLDPDHTTTDPASWVFGFGRRICPGQHLGESSVFIFIATLLATFTFSQVPGEPLVPSFESHLIRYPKPFRCRIEPRSQERTELVQHRAAQMES